MSTANTGIPIHIAVVASALIKTFAVVTAVLDSGAIPSTPSGTDFWRSVIPCFAQIDSGVSTE